MKNNKSIWDELNELPRNEETEKITWQQIKSNINKPKYSFKILTGIVTIAIALLVLSLIKISDLDSITIQQSTLKPTVTAAYFLDNTEFDEFHIKASSWVTFINKNENEEQLKELQKYIENSNQVDKPSPSTLYLHGSYTDVILTYSDHSSKKLKILVTEPGYFYDIDTRHWYFNNDQESSNKLYEIFKEQQKTWLSLFVFINFIFITLAEKLIKRKYKLKKIVYAGDHPVAKYIFYGKLVLLLLFYIAVVLNELNIHIIWIFAITALSIFIDSYIETKYGENRAALYLCISTHIGFLLFILAFAFNW